MVTFNQYLNGHRKGKKKRKSKSHLLGGNPQRKAVCLKSTWVAPKKPNSARRKVAWVNILAINLKVLCKLIGEYNTIQQYSMLLIRGGRTQDVPGLRYKIIRGKLDARGAPARVSSRSKFGSKRWRRKSEITT